MLPLQGQMEIAGRLENSYLLCPANRMSWQWAASLSSWVLLILAFMWWDIVDNPFACFLCTSMPQMWNYIFTALPDVTSMKYRQVNHQRPPGHEIQHTSQLYAHIWATFLHTLDYITDGHWSKDCHSKGKWAWSKKEKKEDNENENEQDKGRGKAHFEYQKGNKNQRQSRSHNKKVNQAITSNLSSLPDQSSDASLSTYLTGNSFHSHFGWILNNSATNHICTKWMAFAMSL